MNRFDPQKKIELAIGSFIELCKKMPQKLKHLQLVIAGIIYK